MSTRSLLLLLLLAAAGPLPPQLTHSNTAEGWIWQRVQAGQPADLNDRCNTETLAIRKLNDERWGARCRRVAPDLLRALLTQPDLADHAPHGVLITGAHIDGSLDFADAHIKAAVVMLDASWITGDVVLADARLDGILSLRDTLIEGNFASRRTFVGSNLVLDRTVFGGPVDLKDAHVYGGMDMDDASTADKQPFDAARLHVGTGLFLRNMRLGGPVDLSDADVNGQMNMDDASIADKQPFDAARLHVGTGGLFLRNMKFRGPVVLRDAHVDGGMSMDDASTADKQPLDAGRLHVGTGLFLRNMKLGGPVHLSDADVTGQMNIDDTSIADKQPFDAGRLHVGTGGLFLRNAKFGGPVFLRGSDVSGVMNMAGASTADKQPFDADGLHVGTNLFLDRTVFGGPVDLRDAHVDGGMEMEGASTADKQPFDAQRLHVGTGGLFLRNMKFGGSVVLTGAHVDAQMDMEGASIADKQDFFAERLQVGADLLMHNLKFGGWADLSLIVVDGGIDLRNSHTQQLYLSGAVVRGDLVIGGSRKGSEEWLHWDACDGSAPCLDLRNARVGNLQDDERAWPTHITLEGFTYTHLGGISGDQRQDMRNRPIRWWRHWLSRDPVYSSQPYAQLAGVLTAAGNRDGSADIRFFGRDRERSELLRECTWQGLAWLKRPDGKLCGLHQWGAWLGMSALQMFIGYGIGDYSFRAAGWALALALIGTVILSFAPGVRGVRPVRFMTRAPRGSRQQSLLWCFAASLHKVLPLITISQEFNDFFNDPQRERLHAWQHVAFGVLAVCGWVLAGFVAAAFSGLIQT